MRFAVLTTFYNEEIIAPFFLNHYKDWTEVRVLLETDTTDNTRQICEQYPNVVIEDVHMTAGFSDREKVLILTDAIKRMRTFEWVAVLDSDELIVSPKPMMAFEGFLRYNEESTHIYACMPRVYRHRLDSDLDATKPTFPQRLHGILAHEGEVKPLCMRPQFIEEVTIGCHSIGPNTKCIVSPHYWLGSHWCEADPVIAVSRGLTRKARFSEENLKKGWGNHHFNHTEASIRKNLELHQDDPLLAPLARLI